VLKTAMQAEHSFTAVLVVPYVTQCQSGELNWMKKLSSQYTIHTTGFPLNFKKKFGDSVKLTPNICKKICSLKLDFRLLYTCSNTASNPTYSAENSLPTFNFLCTKLVYKPG